MSDTEPRDGDRGGAQKKERRPYQPPAIEESAQFETLALACGKNDPDVDFDCLPVDPSSS